MAKKHFKLFFLIAIISLFVSCSGSVSSRGRNVKRSASESLKALSSSEGPIWKAVPSGEEQGSVILENSKYILELDKRGASVKSLVLKEWNEKGSPLELVLRNDEDDRAFLTYPNRDLTSPLLDVFKVESLSSDIAVFSCKYMIDGSEAVLKKSFRITNDYAISVSVDLDLSSSIEGDIKYFYTMGYEPKFGPSMLKNSRSGHNDRNYFIYRNGSKKLDKLKFDGDIFSYEGSFKWFELTGKYFAMILMPSQPERFHISAVDNTLDMTSMYVSRIADGSTNLSDSINYYIGPQLKDKLKAFDYKEHNALSLSGMNLSKAMQKGGSFTWLQNILRLIMSLFYKIIPNWGVAIVLLTLLVKALLFPLYKKSMKSSQAMQKIAPELDKLRAQYKDSPEMLNRATLELYRKHKISPTSSLVPLLIQFPVLLAMYGLLNNRFELRDAVFIPGWINDLSSPDTVAVLPFSIPLLGNEIHVLPFIYFLSMIFSMMYTRSLSQGQNQSKASQRFMYIIMPIFFFFTLYNISSGLLVYWTVANIISIIQQVFMNNIMKNKGNNSDDKDNKSHNSKGPLYNPNIPPKAKK